MEMKDLAPQLGFEPRTLRLTAENNGEAARSYAENPLILWLLKRCASKIIARLRNKVVTNKVTQGFMPRPLRLPATDRPAPKPWMLDPGLSHRQLMAQENRGSRDSRPRDRLPQ